MPPSSAARPSSRGCATSWRAAPARAASSRSGTARATSSSSCDGSSRRAAPERRRGTRLPGGFILGTVSTPERSVVCRSCGSEVSPYVTECPYCGARLRRRAPKLEREGDELRVRESLRARRRRILRERRAKLGRARPRLAIAADRPYVTIAAILGPAALVVIQRAGGYPFTDLGVIVYPGFAEAWRYLTSPFVYDHLGYLFVVGLA